MKRPFPKSYDKCSLPVPWCVEPQQMNDSSPEAPGRPYPSEDKPAFRWNTGGNMCWEKV